MDFLVAAFSTYLYVTLDLLVLLATSAAVVKVISMSIPRAPAPLLDSARGAAYRARYRRDEGGPRSDEPLEDGEERLVGTIRARNQEPVFALEIGQQYKLGPRLVPTLSWFVWLETDRRQTPGTDFVLETTGGDSYLIDVDAETQFVPTFVEASRGQATRQLRGELVEGSHVIVYGTIDRSPSEGALTPYRDTTTKIVGRVHGAPNAPMIVADAKIGPGQLALWSGPAAVPEIDRSAMYGQRLRTLLVPMIPAVPATIESLSGSWVSFGAAVGWYIGLVLILVMTAFVIHYPYDFRGNPSAKEKAVSSDVVYRALSWARVACVSRWMVAQRAPLNSPEADDEQMKIMKRVRFPATR